MEYINSKSADALRKHKRRVHVLEVDTALAGCEFIFYFYYFPQNALTSFFLKLMSLFL